MSYWVEYGIKELKEWEQRLFEALERLLTPEKISYYLDEISRDIYGLYERAKKEEGVLSKSIFAGISSLFQIRALLKELAGPMPDQVPIELAARFATLSFRAGLNTGMFAPGRTSEILEYALNSSEKEFTEKLQSAGKNAISESAKRSVASRHAPLREAKEKAAKVARELWQSGSCLLHHEMAIHLVEEYQDENKRHPFTSLPGVRDENTIKILRKVTKAVAQELERPDLIYNQFK